jgi:hypothetical protein
MLKEFDRALFAFKANNCQYISDNQIDMSYEYCREDYLTSAPYEEIFAFTDPFERTVQLENAAIKAKDAGFTNFKKACGCLSAARRFELCFEEYFIILRVFAVNIYEYP